MCWWFCIASFLYISQRTRKSSTQRSAPCSAIRRDFHCGSCRPVCSSPFRCSSWWCCTGAWECRYDPALSGRPNSVSCSGLRRALLNQSNFPVPWLLQGVACRVALLNLIRSTRPRCFFFAHFSFSQAFATDQLMDHRGYHSHGKPSSGCWVSVVGYKSFLLPCCRRTGRGQRDRRIREAYFSLVKPGVGTWMAYGRCVSSMAT